MYKLQKMFTKIMTMFLLGFMIGVGYFIFTLIAVILNDKIIECRKIEELKYRGIRMVTEYDIRKNRCKEMGGKYNVVETSTYYNEWCSGYNQQ